MKNSLYRLPEESHLPTFDESLQQFVWSKEAFPKNTILLPLKEGVCLSVDMTGHHIGPEVLARPLSFLLASYWELDSIIKKEKKEFEETGKIKGFLFLAPDLTKVWVSHYDFKYLKKVS